MKKLMIIVAALTMVASFALTAAAAEWNFYGSARVATFVEDPDVPGADNNSMTYWDKQGNSRLGATVKVSDTMTGGFELGLSSSVSTRKIYGEWNFGAGKLLVGQTYTPACTYFYSNQVWAGDNDLLDVGQQYAGRQPMLRLTFGDFKIAFIKMGTGYTYGGFGAETTLPKIEAAYNLKMDNFFIDISGGYNSYEVNNRDIDSYLVALGGGMDFGAAYVNANVYYAQNGQAYGLLSMSDDTIGFNPVDGIVDMDTLGYLLVAGFKVNDMLTIEAGYGAIENELDQSNSNSDDSATYYLNCSITLAPGVFVVPEIGVRDYKDNAAGADEGDMTYFGAKWQMNF